MNFDAFVDALQALERSITITTPIRANVHRAYWGAPSSALNDLPAAINTLVEPDRTLGFGSRQFSAQVSVQLMVARAGVADDRTSRTATAFWFAAKDAFDRDTSIGGTVSFSTLRGANPTVPVILTHSGQNYIGFNGLLDIQDVRAFNFGGA